MDNENVIIQTAPRKNSVGAVNLILRIVSVIIAVAATVLALWALKSPDDAVAFSSLSSSDEIKDGQIYLMEDMLSAGIFMYMGDSEQKGEIRKSNEGVFLKKEYVYSYHTLAMADGADGKCLVIFSVTKDDGDIFDAVADHDKKENQEGDPGNYFPVSAYVTAKCLEGDAAAEFAKSKEKHGNTVGLEQVNWIGFEMEYLCKSDADYKAVVTAERREWLMISVYAMPLVLVIFGLSFVKPKKNQQ